ncbi:MAG: glycosyltransferase family 39 protein [Candidatus Omnitrophica bacterium]|nr:glycosyltransferase family 39 protein [Candidatus Omnitrophota bacterium]
MAVFAQQTLETHRLHYLFGPGYPLTVLLGSFFVWITSLFSNHDSVFAVNLMSVVLSSFSVGILYILVKKLFNPRVAFFSSFLFSIFPIFLGISVYGMSHAPAIFFFLLGILFLLQFDHSRRGKDLLLSSLCLGLMGACRIQDLAFISIPASYLLFIVLKKALVPLNFRKTFLRLIVFWIGTGIIAATFHLPLLLSSMETNYSSQMSRFWEKAITLNFLGISPDSLFYTSQNIIFGLTPVGFLLGILGFFWIYQNDRKKFFFLILWFFIPFLFYGNIWGTVPRFYSFFTIPLIIAIGYTFDYLLKYKNLLFKITLGLIFNLIILTLFFNMYPILKFRHDHALLPEVARFIAQHTESNAVVITGDESFFFNHYGNVQTLSKPAYELYPSDGSLQEFKKEIDALLEKNTPLYITSTGLYSYDNGKFFSTMMKKSYHLHLIGRHLSEDWHKGETRLRTGWEYLWRIEPENFED